MTDGRKIATDIVEHRSMHALAKTEEIAGKKFGDARTTPSWFPCVPAPALPCPA